jgi:hypothetical protein
MAALSLLRRVPTSTTTTAKTVVKAPISVPVVVGKTTASQVVVPDGERKAYLRWYTNVLGPGKYATPGAGGVVKTTQAVYDRFKKAQARINALVSKEGTKGTDNAAYAKALYDLWNSADLDGLSAFDREVVGGAPGRDPNRTFLTHVPRGLMDWFSSKVRGEKAQLGISTTAAVTNVMRRGLTAAEKQTLFGFAIAPTTAAWFRSTPGVTKPAGEPAPVTVRPLFPGGGMIPSGGGEPDLEPPVYENGEAADELTWEEQARRAKIRNTAVLTGAGAGVGALGGHLLKKSKGWGALIGAGAGLVAGLFVLPALTSQEGD